MMLSNGSSSLSVLEVEGVAVAVSQREHRPTLAHSLEHGIAARSTAFLASLALP